MIWKEEQKITAGYFNRSEKREIKLMTATMNLVAYFMGLGDTQENAEIKVSTISTEVAAYLYVYKLGNKQPLFDAINLSVLPFMDATAKTKLIGDLTA